MSTNLGTIFKLERTPFASMPAVVDDWPYSQVITSMGSPTWTEIPIIPETCGLSFETDEKTGLVYNIEVVFEILKKDNSILIHQMLQGKFVLKATTMFLEKVYLIGDHRIGGRFSLKNAQEGPSPADGNIQQWVYRIRTDKPPMEV